MDNTVLLMKVLKIHYRNHLETLNQALNVLKDYSSNELVQIEYDKAILTLKNVLNDLPTDILNYFLTLVPLPKRTTENNKKNEDTSAKIRNILLEYLNNGEPLLSHANLASGKNTDSNKNAVSHKLSDKDTKICKKETIFKNTLRSIKRPLLKPKRRSNRGLFECKKLLDLCAEYIVTNQSALTQDYTLSKNKIWYLLNSNKFTGCTLDQLYTVLRDINKKIKWLRLLDTDEITDEIIKEEYGNSNIFIKERHLEAVLKNDPFTLSSELKEVIKKM